MIMGEREMIQKLIPIIVLYHLPPKPLGQLHLKPPSSLLHVPPLIQRSYRSHWDQAFPKRFAFV